MGELLKVDDLDKALEKLYKEYINYNFSIPTVKVSVKDAYDRILAEDVYAKYDVPGFDKSTVDGYAVIAKDTDGASDTIPTFLNITGEAQMGENMNLSINSGECIYVPTGAMIPKNADACVMVENTEKITESKVAIYESVSSKKNIILKSADCKKGSIIFKAGRKLSASDLGMLSSISIDEIKVYKKWSVSIISTGDELVDNETDLRDGKIRDINSILIYSLLKKYNMESISINMIKDDAKQLEETLLNAIKESDVVVISGGSSKGKKDMTATTIEKVTKTKVLTHGLAIKPGKPTITAIDKESKTIIIGLPGHPVAAAILFKLIVVNLYHLLTHTNDKYYTCRGKITENLPSSPGRLTIQLVNVDKDFNVIPIYGKSGVINTLSSADGYIMIPKDSEGLKKNSDVIVYYI